MTMSTPKPSLRDRQRELTRQSICDAALAAFEHKGYPSVTVDDIVKLAGVSRATFYLHFDSKAAVLRALRTKRLGQWSPDNNPHWGTAERESIHDFFERMVDFYQESPILYKSLHEARAYDPVFADEHRKLVEQQATRWIERDHLQATNPTRVRIAVLMMYTLLDSFMYLWLIQGWDLDREETVDAMTDALTSVMS